MSTHPTDDRDRRTASPQAAPLPRAADAVPGRPVIDATPGDGEVTLTWPAVPGTQTYRLYRGTSPNGQASTPVATGIEGVTYIDTGLANGTPYFYRLSAVNATGEGLRSEEDSATPSGPAPPADAATLSAFRLVRQTSFGPRPGDVERVKAIGRAAYLEEQLAMPASEFPDSLFSGDLAGVQQHFMRLALTGRDQLRQRMAFALSKIWAVDANELNRSDATVTYYRIFLNRAFGNYRDLMTDMTLNPAMGQFLNLVNSRSEASTGMSAVENFPRELLQLFTLGSQVLANDGSVREELSYTQSDIRALSRLLTGWTFGDGNPATVPTGAAMENWRVPLEPVERFHDTTAKILLGVEFPADRTAREDLNAALDVIFAHPNLPPFLARQLITQLVTSNPSPAYIDAVASALIDNGEGRRGDLAAALRAIFLHPEADLGGGKLMEPVLYLLSCLRTLGATVTDYRTITRMTEEMGQKILYPPSVFSYFSPQYQIRGTDLLGPEFQVLTSVTAFVRTNFAAHLVNDRMDGVAPLDLAPFNQRAPDAAGLTDFVAQQFLGGQLSTAHRNAILTAINDTPATDRAERTRTALYLVLTSAQYQVER